MTEYKDLVWEAHGYSVEKSDIFDEEEKDEVFYEGETLADALLNVFTETHVWKNKYNDEIIFYTEKEALEDAIDRAEIVDEIDILQKKQNELDGIDDDDDE